MIAITHAVFAWLLAVVFGLNPIITIIFSLVPDMEFILNTVHRGPLHSLFFVIPVCLFAYFYYKDNSVSVGLFSHLFLDSLTVMGLPLFYPLIQDYFSLHFYNSTKLEWIVIVLSSVLLINAKKLFKKELNPKILVFSGFLWFFLLVTFKFLVN